ncbi:hypothetical protein PVAND_006748 [Polypedilum vanderplanki]|uniref:Polypeptide N-acetylgalactosaminyltransferase n=1 Tax=Polypedilum vanderplanki TaxID=319348 RepID=A0A9J6C555_POLVA|nr:hypothetical protein PVAND_006748 [Polypedilum vanderplanki]
MKSISNTSSFNNLLPSSQNILFSNDKIQKQNHQFGAFFGRIRNEKLQKIDWHDYEQIKKDAQRIGFGENGKSEKLDETEKSLEDDFFRQNGFNALLSDKISINRSIPDIRHVKCKEKKYLSELPSVSVIIPFYNEHFSTLLRTVYSVINRSPSDLLNEIILVDDCSKKDFLKDKLDSYVRENLPKVKIVRMKERGGLVTARTAGAKIANGDVLIFLDSHTEANVNWLPPLIEPIAENYRICVCPFIDVIAYDTFEYRAQDEGARGAFDWQLFYKRLPLTKKDLENPTEPFNSPVMAGGLFAISSKFFWELGGYDEGLQIWGGEQYELSFKIWQCHGKIVDAPCSRVGHIYRKFASFDSGGKGDYLTRNHKRVVETWMDEPYKSYVYNKNLRYKSVDAGDLTKQKEIREKLKCKSFDWFMKEVAFDLMDKYPPVEPPDFANGAIWSISNPNFCVDTMNGQSENDRVSLNTCSSDLKNPRHSQFFALSWQRDIRLKNLKTQCWDVSESGNAPIVIYGCHAMQGNQLFRYLLDTKQIQHVITSRCLDADFQTMKLFVSNCDSNSLNQKWNFGNVNSTALNNWEISGAKLI